ncbi:MAG: methyl-accepting chemotaxis protein [Roseburia sp.]
MKENKIDLSIPYEADRKRNKMAVIAIDFMNIMMAIVYVFEVLKGNTTWGVYFTIATLCIVPTILSIVCYNRKKDSKAIRYILGIGFLCMYSVAMYTRETNMVFCYIIMVYVALVIYADAKLSRWMGAGALVINILAVMQMLLRGDTDAQAIMEMEIAISCVVLSWIFSVIAVNTINVINQANINKAIEEKQQTKSLLDTVLDVSDSVAVNVKHADEEMARLRQSIYVTKDSMEGLAREAGESANAILVQQENTKEITHHVDRVGEVANNISTEVEKVKGSISVGQEVMENLLKQVKDSETISGEVAGKLDGLKEYTSRMKEILDVIQNVTDETSLLSLNASIEAARAGEAGKGFAVVATEISGLARQTGDATDDINTLIENIGQSMTEVIASVEELIESNRKQNEFINETAECFEQIQQNTDEVLKGSSDLNGVVSEVAKANESIGQSIQNISMLTEEVTSSAKETLKGNKADLESVEGVSDIMGRLTETAEQLGQMQRITE